MTSPHNKSVRHDIESLEPRLSSLETAVFQMTRGMDSLQATVDAIRNNIAQSQKPQWGNIISAVTMSTVIISAIGAAFVSPLTIITTSHQKTLDERSMTLVQIQDRLREVESVASTNEKLFSSELQATREKLEEVGKSGSGITRERLAVIENQMRIINAKLLANEKNPAALGVDP